MQAIWKNKVIAESSKTIKVEGNVYFPEEAVHDECLSESNTQYTCPWKGEATYFNLEVDGQVKPDGAWSYQHPKPDAKYITRYIAFDPAITIQE